MGKYVDLFMIDVAKFGLKVCEKLDQLSHKIMAWAYKTDHRLYEKYGQDLGELF